eukprot:1183674-Ditylum_brightwellii.AAC.1
MVLMMMLTMVMMIVLKMVMVMVMMMMMVLMVLTSTSHISHKQLIVVLHREVNKTSMLFCKKDDDVEDDVDDGVVNSADDGVDGADKHLTHLSQGVD